MKKFGTFLFSLLPFLIALTLQFAVSFHFAIIAQILFPVLSPFGNIYDLYEDLDFNTLVAIVWSISCSALFAIWYYRSCGGDYRFNLAKQFHPAKPIGLLLLVPATQFATSILISEIAMIAPQWLEEYESLLDSSGMGEEVSILMMIYSVCLAPISEELIFRGVTMRLARRAFPFWFANILQALLFGIFHMNMLQGR